MTLRNFSMDSLMINYCKSTMMVLPFICSSCSISQIDCSSDRYNYLYKNNETYLYFNGKRPNNLEIAIVENGRRTSGQQWENADIDGQIIWLEGFIFLDKKKLDETKWEIRDLSCERIGKIIKNEITFECMWRKSLENNARFTYHEKSGITSITYIGIENAKYKRFKLVSQRGLGGGC